MKYLQAHWIVVFILFSSSIIGAFLNFQSIWSYLENLLREPREFSGVICSSRDPETDCAKENQQFLEFVYQNGGTALPVTLNLKYLVRAGWMDVCANGSVKVEPHWIGGTGTTVFFFYGDEPVRTNALGDCVNRMSALVVPHVAIPFSVEDQVGYDLTYVIAGRYLITRQAMGTMIHEITLTKF